MKDIYKHLEPIPPQTLLSAEPLFGLLRPEQFLDKEHLVSHLALTISVPRKTIYRWMKSGISLFHAENVAFRLGIHPTHIWGPEYHIASYMEEIREKFIANHRSKKSQVRRTIKRNQQKELETSEQSK